MAFEAGIAITLAVIVVYRLSNPVPAGEWAATVKLVLASRDLESGSIIREGDLVLTDWPDEVPTNEFSHTHDVVGRGVVTKIYAKEPILESRLTPSGAVGAFASTTHLNAIVSAKQKSSLARDRCLSSFRRPNRYRR